MAELNPSRSSEALVGNVSSEPEMMGKPYGPKVGYITISLYIQVHIKYRVTLYLIYLTDGLIKVTSVKVSLDSQLEEAKLFTVKHLRNLKVG